MKGFTPWLKSHGSTSRLLKISAKWLAVGLVLVVFYHVGYYGAALAESFAVQPERGCTATVLIDAGHGGTDPGKIGVNGALEKDLNLEIARKLKKYLEWNDVKVYMTRDDDRGLYGESSSRKKVQDLKNRVSMAQKLQPDLTISIHQNSYPEAGVRGAQVFYYGTSEQSRLLAGVVQETLRELDPSNKRQVKSNTSYYLLKKVPGTIIIAECGFLSNEQEAAALCDAEYQDRLAFKLNLGIMRYLAQR